MTNTPWVIRPATGDGFAITYRTEREVKRIRAETREDLESLRDLLTEYLAPDELATPTHTHLAVFNVKTASGATGWMRRPVALSGAPSPETVVAMEDRARGEYGALSVLLVNLIPLGSA
jgi:hypothetical protein